MAVGESLQVWGPLGTAVPPVDPSERVTLVAGGIGQTPFLAYARELLGTRGYGGDAPRKRTQKVSLYYGVRTAALAAGVEDFRAAGVEVHLASDDGSVGTKGFVTQLLASHGKTGPAGGLRSGADAARAGQDRRERGACPARSRSKRRWPAASGICFSCVTKVQTPDGWDYKRVCVDGPVFDGGSTGVGVNQKKATPRGEHPALAGSEAQHPCRDLSLQSFDLAVGLPRSQPREMRPG